jgi:hypothetical protein
MPEVACFVSAEQSCRFCNTQFFDLVKVKAHYEQCEDARDQVTTFTRKDKLTGHLRSAHSTPPNQHDAFIWSYGIDSGWPKECGFCGRALQSWDEGVAHLVEHFKQGSRIQSWKLPFVVKPHAGSENDFDRKPYEDFFEEIINSQPEISTKDTTGISPTAILATAVMALVRGVGAWVGGVWRSPDGKAEKSLGISGSK